MILYNKALIFAVKAHGNQKRKYTGDPYIVHPIAVADLVERCMAGGVSPIMMEHLKAAAVLHDTIEDTEITYGDIQIEFGIGIADLVDEVTDASAPSDGNRAARKAIDRDHIRRSSSYGASIKLADLINNTESIVKYDKDFAKVYLKEKKLLLNVLTHGHPVIYKEALRTFTQALKMLAEK